MMVLDVALAYRRKVQFLGRIFDNGDVRVYWPTFALVQLAVFVVYTTLILVVGFPSFVSCRENDIALLRLMAHS